MGKSLRGIFTRSLALASATAFMGTGVASASPCPDRKIAQYINNPNTENVTVVSSLQNVQTTDVAFAMLQSIANRYGCSPLSQRTLTRYEFAAGLNACIDKLNEAITAGLGSKINKEDIAALQKLQEEFAAELASFRGRVDALESKTATLQSQQFSTTTKLSGQAIISPTNTPAPNSPGRIRLNLDTSFISRDQLYTRLQTSPKNVQPANRLLPIPNPTTVQAPEKFDRRQQEPSDREGYNAILENPFLSAIATPLSTFGIDVDTASFSNIRRFITNGQMPPKDAVRIEELINYFTYNYPQPEGDRPFSISTEVATAPWSHKHKLVHIGLQGKQIATEKLPPSNLVFLIDVSGSMNDPAKLPLLKSAFKLLVKELRPQDKVSIVVYAGNAGLVLPSTSGDRKDLILAAIDRLNAGGSTAGGAGIQLAYKVAKENFLTTGNNRVILATDGDFNVGVSSDGELVRLIEQKREQGVFLSVLGFGTGNYQDAKMEQLADKGNGNYAYIDTLKEARKVLVEQMAGTLVTIAKDVKLQVEFNPAKVQAFRLIGYENRLLRDRDFNDDKKDAGDLGAGHTVTALYEIIPTGIEPDVKLPAVDTLKYQRVTTTANADNGELMQVKLRYKAPNSNTSQLIASVVSDRDAKIESASENFKFSSSVASFGMILRDSEYKGKANLDRVLAQAKQAKGLDREGYRSDFIGIVERYRTIASIESSRKRMCEVE
jgi:Ca-activated chloride channel homolog